MVEKHAVNAEIRFHHFNEIVENLLCLFINFIFVLCFFFYVCDTVTPFSGDFFSIWASPKKIPRPQCERVILSIIIMISIGKPREKKTLCLLYKYSLALFVQYCWGILFFGFTYRTVCIVLIYIFIFTMPWICSNISTCRTRYVVLCS